MVAEPLPAASMLTASRSSAIGPNCAVLSALRQPGRSGGSRLSIGSSRAICQMQTRRRRFPYAVSVLAANALHSVTAAPLAGIRNEPAAPGECLIGGSAHASPAGGFELFGKGRLQLHGSHLRLRPSLRFPSPTSPAAALRT